MARQLAAHAADKPGFRYVTGLLGAHLAATNAHSALRDRLHVEHGLPGGAVAKLRNREWGRTMVEVGHTLFPTIWIDNRQ